MIVVVLSMVSEQLRTLRKMSVIDAELKDQTRWCFIGGIVPQILCLFLKLRIPGCNLSRYIGIVGRWVFKNWWRDVKGGFRMVSFYSYRFLFFPYFFIFFPVWWRLQSKLHRYRVSCKVSELHKDVEIIILTPCPFRFLHSSSLNDQRTSSGYCGWKKSCTRWLKHVETL